MPASLSVNASKAMLVGSSTSKKYHLSDCRYALEDKAGEQDRFPEPGGCEETGISSLQELQSLSRSRLLKIRQ